MGFGAGDDVVELGLGFRGLCLRAGLGAGALFWVGLGWWQFGHRVGLVADLGGRRVEGAGVGGSWEWEGDAAEVGYYWSDFWLGFVRHWRW